MSEIQEHEMRRGLESEYGQVWSTSELTQDFTVRGFLAPYCMVTRKSDGARGTMEFNARPRFYFDFREE